MNIGIDLHGVLDTHTVDLKIILDHAILDQKSKIYLISGGKVSEIKEALKELDISEAYFDGIFSLQDYLDKFFETKAVGKNKHQKNLYPDHTWNKVKGHFARRLKLDIHFDDTKEYTSYFPEYTQFIYVNNTSDNLLIQEYCIAKRYGKITKGV